MTISTSARGAPHPNPGRNIQQSVIQIHRQLFLKLSDFDMIYDEGNDEQWNIDLLTASAVGDREAVQNILHSKKSHLNLDQVLINSRGWSPIMFAAYFGHAGLVSLLMEDLGFNVRDKNDKGTA